MCEDVELGKAYTDNGGIVVIKMELYKSILKENYQIAVISDIHGNRWALEAVLEDIKKRYIGIIVNLGDSVYGPLDPAGTVEMIANSKIISISGNEDEILFQQQRGNQGIVDFVKNRLNLEQLNWLRNLPDQLILEEDIIMFHGSPGNKTEFFLEKPEYGYLSCKSNSEIKQEIKALDQSVVICGHSHLPALYRFSDDRIVMNPGSIGLQAFTDDQPEFHYVQNGTPHARYSILKRKATRWQIEKVELSYNWEAASREALKNGRLEWSEWLRTGKICADIRCIVS